MIGAGGSTPAALGYRMPAEWHRHEATWLTWPKDPLTWPDRVPQVREIFLRMIEVLAEHEVVNLLVDDEETAADVRRRMPWPHASHVRLHLVPTVDSWIRDYGPNFIVREGQSTRAAAQQDAGHQAQAALTPGAATPGAATPGSGTPWAGTPGAVMPGAVMPGAVMPGAGTHNLVAFNDWGFNAWGGKYEALIADTRVPARLEPILGMPRFPIDVVLEGGSIDVNGAGVVMTTEQCLLNVNRNPAMDRAAIERVLCDHLGVQQVLWLGEGVTGDDTDGHIDDIARFVSPTTIVCAAEEDPVDPNHHVLRDNIRRLELARDPHGRPYRVVTLPMPGRVLADGEPLPASYANFYIANNVVLLPVYGHANDQRAVDVLQPLFPDRRVVAIDCEPLVWGMGAIHCVTQQQPASFSGR